MLLQPWNDTLKWRESPLSLHLFVKLISESGQALRGVSCKDTLLKVNLWFLFLPDVHLAATLDHSTAPYPRVPWTWDLLTKCYFNHAFSIIEQWWIGLKLSLRHFTALASSCASFAHLSYHTSLLLLFFKPDFFFLLVLLSLPEKKQDYPGQNWKGKVMLFPCSSLRRENILLVNKPTSACPSQSFLVGFSLWSEHDEVLHSGLPHAAQAQILGAIKSKWGYYICFFTWHIHSPVFL